jgi:protease-4
MSLFDCIKSVFLILILLNFAPSLLEGIHTNYNRYINPKTPVGVITIKDNLCSSGTYTKQLYDYFKNPDIKAILLVIDCPGGAAGTSQAVHNEILALKNDHHKPIIVLVENICASGAYYIACAADYIITPGTALIGSIGACMPYFFQLRECIEQYKIHYTPIKAGAHKSAGDPFTDLSKDDHALLQIVDDSYQQFAQDVAQCRKLSMTTVSEWANGKIFSGNQAFKLGLVDELGSAYTAIRRIKEKALIEGDIEWIHPPQQGSLATLLGIKGDDESSSLFTHFAQSFCTFLEQRYAKPRLE